MMRGEKGEKQVTLARLFDTIFGELSEVTQANYDNVIEQFKNFPAMDRIVPVEQEISDIVANVKSDIILPFEEIHKILDAHDTFCVVHCYCRHEKDLLNRNCKLTNDRQNCVMFGKTAQFAIKHNFGKKVSKEEMLEILKKTEEQGLVHKAIHIGLDPNKGIEGICNCCRCCCGIFELWYRGITPLMTYTSYISKVDEENCNSCELCIQKCPIEAITMTDEGAFINAEKCLGCGVCVHFCPQKAIKIERTGERMVYVPPPRLEVKN